ncbi:hypothetical protein [Streptomyces lydicamycinicus]|uniref:hypothetical protein n=1 Tax=Streptomyces lydicamycinicus TaxID=1546107 RepID=UPI0005A81331
MATASSPSAVDLRAEPVDEVLDRVERSLDVRLERGNVVRKRRSVGARTERGTWVRLERRPLARIDGQGWNGTEAAAALEGVAMPRWLAGVAWRDASGEAMWRADETTPLPGAPVKPGGTLTVDSQLSGVWWGQLNRSLDALARQTTTRIATPDTVTITQARVTQEITSTFGDLDTTLADWRPAHADLNWANVTGPMFCLFDWEDWGMAPRGLDAASLWGNSLALPGLAERVWRERREDLESRDGLLMALFYCTKVVGRWADEADPKLAPARIAAERIVGELQAR